ncbi:GntR family transcriptional regulator [Thermomonospora cellulosilytica]|uniref:DNA-binding GntR family transcriptional regulator n=1 Tax=Thermomonospora cellulosilytica TaxID=1411118 RepID=A0A7W3MXC7_9ACTN|nr:GntR family transcriptional regulator [Thermomonospora cellulosilytica]MBA9003642.1 DNA-binding GntR family transcriptional regulator [Thermomonospora cellulosilytica]
MSVDLEGPEPLYRQIAAVIAGRIKNGTYRPNRAVPSEAQICEEFGVSRRTARSAYAVLAEQGLIITVPGRGTFVAPQSSEPPAGP